MAVAKKAAKPKRERMTLGAGWRLYKTRGIEGQIAGTLLWTRVICGKRIAVFSVPVR